MFQTNWKCSDGEGKFFKYNPEYEREQREKRTIYLLSVQKFQAIKPGKGAAALEAPLFTDKKYAQPGAG
jgi:hypothetical protein